MEDINPPYRWRGNNRIIAAMLKSPLVCKDICSGHCGKPFHLDYRAVNHVFPKRRTDFARIVRSITKDQAGDGTKLFVETSLARNLLGPTAEDNVSLKTLKRLSEK